MKTATQLVKEATPKYNYLEMLNELHMLLDDKIEEYVSNVASVGIRQTEIIVYDTGSTGDIYSKTHNKAIKNILYHGIDKLHPENMAIVKDLEYKFLENLRLVYKYKRAEFTKEGYFNGDIVKLVLEW